MEINNRKAKYDFDIEDTIECGIVLTGTEVKSIRDGRANLKDSYAIIRNNEVFLVNTHISHYEQGNIFNHDETRDRKLLLHRKEIRKLYQDTRIKGYTVVPVRLYLSKGLAKLEIALAKGKNLHDKRESQKAKDAKREIEKALKNQY